MKWSFRMVLVTGILMLFLGTFVASFLQRNMFAYASGSVYIRANGLVEGTDKITNENNITYTFTDDINDAVVVERNNIVIDGAGYTLNGSLSLFVGFNLTIVSNVTIKNVNILEFGYAIWLYGASQCVISNNTCINNEGGIWLWSSIGNTVSSNNINMSVEAVALDSSSSNTITGNNMTESYYGVYVVENSAGNTISGNNIKDSRTSGIYLNESPNNVILGNNIKDSPNEHICLLYSSNNIISGNTLSNSTADVGIYAYACSLNSFFGNNITSNADSGIRLDMCSDSFISENNISENARANPHGVYLWYSSNITIYGNTIAEYSGYGIFLSSSNENAILSNEFERMGYGGIYLQTSNDNKIQNSIFSGLDSTYGIVLWEYSHRNIVSENTLSLSYYGIALGYSDDNRILNNIVSNTEFGIMIQAVCNNSIIANNAVSNSSQYGITISSGGEQTTRYNVIQANNVRRNGVGIRIASLSGNIIYHNNFVDNTIQTSVSNSINTWDDGYPSGGNYWSDYDGKDQYEGIDQDIPGNDTIGDTPYEINVDNVDRYPLMTQYEPLRQLFLESEGRWNMGEDSNIEVWSVFASDVDDDGVVEIISCAQVNQSGELRIYSYNGLAITLEHSELWQTGGSTRAWAVLASDVDGDGVTEILVGAEARGQIFGQLRIWNWNGTTLTLEHSEEWQTVSWTHVYSVFAADVDDDGVTEIITGGDAFNGTYYNNQLRIWNWNGTTLTLESSREWCTGPGAAVQSVYALDVDGDDIVEIVTAGYDDWKAQLRVWNWNDTTLTLEHSEEWTLVWIARALSVCASDIDGDGNIEIVTGGEAYAQFGSSWLGNGQLRVWNWNGSAITLKDSREWPLNGTYAYVRTICSGDADRDGLAEIMTAGASGSASQLRVWSFNGSTLALDANQESVDEWADAVFALDIDDDGTTEIITAGVAFDATYSYEQIKIWSFPESTPPTITIMSPENKTYPTDSIPLTFNIDEPANWIGYSLNGQANTTITGNATLSTLPDGLHKVVIYANDTYGNMGMSTIYFAVDTITPTADAGPDQTVDEDTVVIFDGSTSTDENGVATYKWTFTDSTPQTLNGKNPMYTFATPGTYTVTLEVADAAGNSAEDTVTITVLDVTDPVANAGLDRTVNEDVSTTLDGSASTDNVGITGYTWTFTDVTAKILTGDKPAYTFSNPGVYTITLNVTDATGHWAIDTVVITVLDITDPVANAGQDQTVNVGETVAFDAGGSTDNVGIVSYDWDFGDGTTGTGKTATHEFANAGTYTVTLTIGDAAGNQATDTMVVTVNSPEVFPTWVLVIVGLVAVGVAVAAIILWKRRKQV